jgi:sarcosine oxidase subunit beta
MAGPAVAVIGAGAVGLSAAWHAAALGADSVTVLERAHVGSGSTGLSAGVFTTQYVEVLELEIRVRSLRVLHTFEADGDLCLHRIGFLRLARDAATMERFEEGARRQRELGVSGARVLDAREVAELVPELDVTDLAGALYGAGDGYMDGHELCQAYRRRAESLGVRVVERRRVVGAEAMGDGLLLHTSGETVRCDVVINAAGAWADAVGAMLDAPVKQVCERHQVCVGALGEPRTPPLPMVMDYVPGGDEPEGLYVRSDGDLLLAGIHTNDALGNRSEDPDAFKRTCDDAYLELVAERLHQRLPGCSGLGLRPGWAGLYPCSPDGEFIIGPAVEDGRVIHACGVGGVGLYTSPATGLLAAEWAVFGELRSVEAADVFAPARFSAGDAQ